jgi:hypothetical protein
MLLESARSSRSRELGPITLADEFVEFGLSGEGRGARVHTCLIDLDPLWKPKFVCDLVPETLPHPAQMAEARI